MHCDELSINISVIYHISLKAQYVMEIYTELNWMLEKSHLCICKYIGTLVNRREAIYHNNWL